MATYSPKARISTEPLDTEKAFTGPAEFRELKRFITKIPLVPHNANYTGVLDDAGVGWLHEASDTATRNWIIPDNATVPYAVGTTLTFVCQHGAGTINVSIAGSDILRLLPAGSTGTRSLPPNSNATALKITATEWQISGTGVG